MKRKKKDFHRKQLVDSTTLYSQLVEFCFLRYNPNYFVVEWCPTRKGRIFRMFLPSFQVVRMLRVYSAVPNGVSNPGIPIKIFHKSPILTNRFPSTPSFVACFGTNDLVNVVLNEIRSSLGLLGGVTQVNLQRQLATPIRNACFSHEFGDMLHLLQFFESLLKSCNALQHCNNIRKKSSATGCYTRTIFRAKLALQIDQRNTTFTFSYNIKSVVATSVSAQCHRFYIQCKAIR